MNDERIVEIRERLRRSLPPGWIVPKKNEAKIAHHRYLSVNFVAGPGFGIEVVPFTNGDVPVAEFVANAPEDITCLLAEVERLKEQADEDRKALDWLQDAAETGCIRICFELDGGVHVTVEPIGGNRYAVRNQDTIRKGIKRLMDGRMDYE